MTIRHLTDNDFEVLLQAINGAFADYIVPFQLNEEQLKFKMVSEDIVLEWSIGVFEENRLVAFMMHGVRTQDAKKQVYNAGTGVLPAYRGRGLVGKMYAAFGPFLKNNGVEEVVLEVIETNRSAIRAYEKDGFSLKRRLLCFGGRVESKTDRQAVKIVSLDKLEWDKWTSFWDVKPSWQSDIDSMENIHPDALGAFMGAELVGYILFSVQRKRIYQLAVVPDQRKKGFGTQLIQEASRIMDNGQIQFNNIDASGEGLVHFLKQRGLANEINQLEMVKSLS